MIIQSEDVDAGQQARVLRLEIRERENSLLLGPSLDNFPRLRGAGERGHRHPL